MYQGKKLIFRLLPVLLLLLLLLPGLSSAAAESGAVPASAAELSPAFAASLSGEGRISVFVATDRHGSTGSSSKNSSLLSAPAGDSALSELLPDVTGSSSGSSSGSENLKKLLKLAESYAESSYGTQIAAAFLGGDLSDSGTKLSTVNSEITGVLTHLSSSSCYYTYADHDEGGSTSGTNGYLQGAVELSDCYLYGISYDGMAETSDAESESQAFTAWAAEADKDKPVLVMSHMPLHTRRGDNDGASIWTAALNEASAEHDIIFMWGHNHTGESQKDTAVYYVAKGGSITPESSSSAVTIGFTYMNAGYLLKGYASLITVTDSEIRIDRFGTDGLSASYTVERRGKSVKGVSLDRTELALRPGASADLTASVSPEDAADPGISWSSSDESVAAVDQEGHVSALAPGSAEITVATADGGFTASCHVIVGEEVSLTLDSRSGNSRSVALLSGAGSLISGTKASVSASEIPGFCFLGWFKDGEEEPISTELSFVITVAEALRLTAVYEPSDITVTVDCDSVKLYADGTELEPSQGGNGFTVPGASLAVAEYTGEADFLYWTDDAGNILGRGRQMSFCALRALHLTAVTSESAVRGSLVVYEYGGSTLFAELVTRDRVTVLPSADSAAWCRMVSGYLYSGTETEVQEEGLKALIGTKDHSLIRLTVRWEEDGEPS